MIKSSSLNGPLLFVTARLSRVVEERFVTEHVLQKGAEDGEYDHKGHEQRENFGAGWDNKSRVRKIKKERARRIIMNDIVDSIKGNHGHSKPVEQYWREPQGYSYYFNNHTVPVQPVNNQYAYQGNQYQDVNQGNEYQVDQNQNVPTNSQGNLGHVYQHHHDNLGYHNNNLHAPHQRDPPLRNKVPHYHNAYYGKDQQFPSYNNFYKKPKLFTWDQERRRRRFLKACKRMHGGNNNRCIDFWWRNDNNPYYESNFPQLSRRTQKILTPSLRRIDQAAMTRRRWRRPHGFGNLNTGLRRQTWVTKIKTKTTFK